MKKKIIKILVLICGLFSFIPCVYAGNLSIWASDTNIINGGKVTVTVKADGLAGKFSVSSSNGNVLSGGTSGEWIENGTKTYTFTSKGVGSATITVKPLDVADFNGSKYTASKSVNINVNKPREKSGNNNLKNLWVEGYDLSPEFNKDTLEYTVNLESNVEKIEIKATKEDGYASLNGTGEKEVQEGDNEFEIKVTSETGNTKTYKINAVVKDSNPIIKKIDGKEYSIVKRASSLVAPDNFEEITVTINDTEIPAFYHKLTKMTVVGLRDSSGEVSLYRYDSKNDSYLKFDSLTSLSKTIVFEDTDEVIEGFEKKIITIVNSEYKVYQRKDNKDYSLIYGIDMETGTKGWYLFHNKEQTIQAYMSEIIDNMNNNFNSKLEKYNIIILGISGFSILLFIVLIIEIIFKNKMKKRFLKTINEQKIESEDSKNIKEDENKELETNEEPIKKSSKKKVKNK